VEEVENHLVKYWVPTYNLSCYRCHRSQTIPGNSLENTKKREKSMELSKTVALRRIINNNRKTACIMKSNQNGNTQHNTIYSSWRQRILKLFKNLS